MKLEKIYVYSYETRWGWVMGVEVREGLVRKFQGEISNYLANYFMESSRTLDITVYRE